VHSGGNRGRQGDRYRLAFQGSHRRRQVRAEARVSISWPDLDDSSWQRISPGSADLAWTRLGHLPIANNTPHAYKTLTTTNPMCLPHLATTQAAAAFAGHGSPACRLSRRWPRNTGPSTRALTTPSGGRKSIDWRESPCPTSSGCRPVLSLLRPIQSSAS